MISGEVAEGNGRSKVRGEASCRLKKIVSKLMQTTAHFVGGESNSLGLVIGRMELLRFIQEEKPELALRELITDVSDQLGMVAADEGPVSKVQGLRAKLGRLIDLCESNGISYTLVRLQDSIRTQLVNRMKSIESLRMAQASLVSFEKASKW